MKTSSRDFNRELLQMAQQAASRHTDWTMANNLMRMAYGVNMNTKSIKALLLRNNDQIVDVDGLMTITNFKMVILEDIVTYTATKPDGSVSQRWIGMDTYVNKVVA